MYEDENGTMIPGSVKKRELRLDFHNLSKQADSIKEVFDDQAIEEETRTAEPIDGDESLDNLLASYGC